MRRSLWRLVSAAVFVVNSIAMLVAAGTDGVQLLTMMSGAVAGAIYATRRPEYSVGGAAVALFAACAVVATGWFALDGDYPLWAWGVALVVGLLTPLIPEVAGSHEDDFSPASLPAEREFAEYARAARLNRP